MESVNLKRVGDLMMTVRETYEEIKELRAQAMSLNSPSLQTEIVSKSNDTDARHTKLVEKCLELQEKCDSALNEALGQISKAMEDIDRLSDIELKNIALLRYIRGEKIDRIAEKMHMDSRTVSRKLKKIDGLLKDVS